MACNPLTLKAAIPAAPLLTITFPAIAQNADGRDTIIVTNTRFETPLDQIGRSVSVINKEETETRQQRFLFDALNNVPGSFGALASVSLRDLPGDQTPVVQDSAVLNDPTSFGASFNVADFDIDAFVIIGMFSTKDVENATGADYQDNPGSGTAPASVFSGVRARF